MKKEIKTGLSDGMNVEVAEGLAGEGPRRRAAAQEDRVAGARRPGPESAMNSLSFLRQMLQDIRHQKMRTLLTLFGITWGTVSVALLVSFGEGLEARIRKNQQGLGESIVIAWPARTSLPFEGLGKGRRIRVTEEDLEALRREIPEARFSGEFMRRERLPPRAGAPHPRHVGHQPGLRGDAQPHPGERRALRQRPRRGPPPAGRLPRQQAQAGPLRRGRRGRADGDDRQRALPRRRRPGEEGPGLELQRPRHRTRPSSPTPPSRACSASATSTTSSSRPRTPRWCPP